MEPQVIETASHILISRSRLSNSVTSQTFSAFAVFATACGCTTYLPSVCHDFSGSLLSYQLDHTSSTPSTNFFCPVSRTRSTPAQHRSLALCSIRDIEGVAKLARHDRKGNPLFSRSANPRRRKDRIANTPRAIATLQPVPPVPRSTSAIPYLGTDSLLLKQRVDVPQAGPA